MQFTGLTRLFEITGYTDRRSVEKFLASLNVRLHKIGKEYCVVTEEFESALTAKYSATTKSHSRKRPASNEHEQAFLKDLQHFLSRV